MTRYTVAVRTLCEFAAKQGDLDLRFTPSPTAQEGVAGHRTVASRRSAAYRRELTLSAHYRHLTVRGRADGFDPGQPLLEEVKTYRGDLERMPANHRQLHWAQAKVYAAMLCRELALPALTVSLVYFDIDRQEEAPPLLQRYAASELEACFAALCERFLAWSELELAHRAARDAALTRLRFPHGEFRPGQRDLAKAVFNAARLGRCLLAQAPTGIGKTVATLFGMLKAVPQQAFDKVFFLTAKGTGRAVALAALDTLQRSHPPLPLRVIELVAREKSCEHPDRQCHGESCPLARGFYDRLPAARAAASSAARLTRPVLREIALAHAVCPYYLGQEVARWCDVVVGDYNHCYDASALLHGLALENSWRTAVLVDEAHNLVDRARTMYTASLRAADLRAVRRLAPDALKKPLDRLSRSWNRLVKGIDVDYKVLDEPPRALLAALKDVVAALGEQLAADAGGLESRILQFYFDAIQFSRLQDIDDADSIIDLSREHGHAPPAPAPGSDTTLCVRNLIPASFLEPRFAAARTTVLFSATLAPWNFYVDTLGLPADTAWLDVEAPFKAEQLTVRIARDVSTRYRHRDRSLAPIARIIAGQFEAAPGNYIAFFSSFDYLEQALDQFSTLHPEIPVWHQRRRMDDGERDGFLARFELGGRGIGFAVLGGTFAEGIDLVGTRLIGAFIATLGLPQVNPVNEALRRRLGDAFGAGYDYAYLFPGIRKVVQAAGRVIRATTDRGVIHLIDDRYARHEVRRLLPGWWNLEVQPGPP
ncbi:MAG: ATP-dependent DNA helicase [Burkholderiales bacterium]|nr:ATP-dependent DNA helicase [Burkholderiales bacterium]MDE1927727.1 ATP-dependent DNA helicase [Burkholderiales bacterium]MDE2157714.1 ATP-dependent DNA helicase [Burkholderiales bacterium]MDE2504966.1 ATP-dependent DNA helicase [Burkholderiales bacterium]